ncbi:MAG: hypothetical protein WHS65_03780 [Melioribacteraceae bacterium]
MNNERKSELKTKYYHLSAEKKLNLSLQLYHSAKELKRTILKNKYPDWDDKKINNELIKIFLYART